jgi:hypothetical protein
MKIKTFKWIIGAAIAMFVFSGIALADDNRARRHGGNGKGYTSGKDIRPGVHAKFRDKRHKFGHYRTWHKHPHRHYMKRPDYRNSHRHYYRSLPPARPYHRHPARSYHRGSDAYYGFSFSIMDPYFAFGFSTGGRW